MSSSKYCTEVQGVRTTVEWTIKNFSLRPHEKGTAIYSQYFLSDDKEDVWLITFYPRGVNSSKEDYPSRFIDHPDAPVPLGVKFELSIIQSGIVVEKGTLIHTHGSSILSRFPNLLPRSCLTDTFTISCKIDKPLSKILRSLSDSSMAMTQELSVDTETGRLTENFTELFENPKFSDVTIIVKDEKFPAHKLVLATRSSVFAAMFENKEMDENRKNEVKIEKMEPSVVKGMLEFIYTDKVSNFDEISNGLLPAADKYDLVRLRALCEKSLAETLSNETAAEILVLADLHRCDNLKKHVMHFIDNHLVDIIDSEGYKEMEENYLGLLKDLIRFIALQRKSEKS